MKRQLNKKQILSLVGEWREQDLKIVFTNGCFDLLHPGHIDSLCKAKNFGDKLVVGINSDHSVKILKGVSRPIITEAQRLKMINALEMVDAAILFHEDTPEQLINEILPDVLVKGNDYKLENIAGADIVLQKGGSVELIELTKGYSTTLIIDKIKKLK